MAGLYLVVDAGVDRKSFPWSVSAERKWPATVASALVTGQVTQSSQRWISVTLYNDADRTGFLVGPWANAKDLLPNQEIDRKAKCTHHPVRSPEQ
jgi:hypothetical protein